MIVKKYAVFIVLFCGSLYSATIKIDDTQAATMIDEREKFFSEVFLVQYDETKIQKDSQNNLVFIDLCKYRTSGYEFPCGNVNGENIGIRKYFIKAKDIKEAYILFRQKHEMKTLPDKNLYDYGESESNKDDEVGIYYIHDIKGKFWVIGMGYDSGSITIYRQTKDYIEVIYQWSIDW